MRKNGFTLVELLVVLVILGLAAGAVALMLPSGGDKVRGEATMLAGRIAALRDRAIVEGRPLGIWIAPTGFGFEARGEDGWEPVTRPPFDDAAPWRGGVVAATGNAERILVRFNSVGMPAAPAVIHLEEQGDPPVYAAVEVAANGDVKALP
ncbi:GspH/FimT family protein [Sphingomicrobium lutaoense]|uniref:Type II secretion system protein H n=1 Tax=Sphingomicrobium lutaoense TaxID=515949 RepID=A0A839Z0M1_9SPHN|nr:GspH/FimT family protein [Sphingomicrobium lutaoense]MBB3764899.1 general secretion pathway protein H [Sphingomicrobium lutaoense]